MLYRNKFFPVLAVCAVIGASAHAETVTTTTITSQKPIPNVQTTNFSAFDLNQDYVLSMSEVGDRLFYIFDTDGNESIDNIEFDQKKVMTIIPMERQTYKFVDFDNDGTVEQREYTHDVFIRQSGLMRFDENMDGLSARDFIEHSFLELDTNESSIIEPDEWEKVYIASVLPSAADQDIYNR